MTRLASIVLAVLTMVAVGACDKPTPEDCRKALENMQQLLGTETFNTPAEVEGEVRRCRGGSKRAAVQCAIKAQTIDELRACDFEKVPGKRPLRTPTSGGSAASGSAAAGSATAGSAMGTGSAK